MIVGHGDIASVLPDRDDLLFFASGVSNSQEVNDAAYKREIDLLMQQDRTKRIVYFSTLSVFYNSTRYTFHKRYMEELIKSQFPSYCILRLGNVTWGTNANHLINFFRNKIKNGEPFNAWDTYRYVVDKEDFLYWIGLIPPWNCEMSISGRRMWVSDIVDEIKKGLI